MRWNGEEPRFSASVQCTAAQRAPGNVNINANMLASSNQAVQVSASAEMVG